jgi:hypothetical protein
MRLLSACAALAILAHRPAFAGGERTDIQGMGMARTFVAGSRGLDAVGINPANLGYPDRGKVTVSLIPFGVHVGTDIITYGVYRDYFTGVATDSGRIGRSLTDADKQKIMEGFHDGVGRAAGDVDFRPIGISVEFGEFGRFALTLTEEVSLFAHVPKEFAQFLFYGNTPGSTFDFSQATVKAQWLREYALSYGRILPRPLFLHSWAAGISVKYIQGFGYFGMEQGNTSLNTGMDGVLQGTVNVTTQAAGGRQIKAMGDGGFTPFPAPAGTGWGIDLGVTGEVNEYLTAGISLTDLGWVTWRNDLEVTRTDSAFTVTDPLQESQRNGVEDALRGKTVPGEEFTTALPTRLRMGVSVEVEKMPMVGDVIPGELTVAMDYNQGFANVPGSSTRARISLGMEYRPWPLLPIRAGVAFGGEDRSNFAIGLGLRFGVVDMEFASENLNWIFSTDNLSYASAAFGLKIRI